MGRVKNVVTQKPRPYEPRPLYSETTPIKAPPSLLKMSSSFLQWSKQLCQFLDMYQPLMDSYIVVRHLPPPPNLFCIFLQEYFTECHWKKLPISWQAALSKISLQEFCHQMFGIEPPLNCVRLTQIFLALNFFLFSS